MAVLNYKFNCLSSLYHIAGIFATGEVICVAVVDINDVHRLQNKN